MNSVVASYLEEELFHEKPIIISTKYKQVYPSLTTISKDGQCPGET